MEPESAAIPSPEMRMAARQHAQEIAEQADRYMLTLEAVVAALRSARLDDRSARAEAVELASAELVRLRTTTDAQRTSLIEPVTSAFSRLRTDLRPLVRFGDLDVQFVEPPATGRGLPGDIAHEARAIVRSTVLALLGGGTARRVRVQWDCDGLNLLIEVRDDGAGTLQANDDAVRPIAERVTSVGGGLVVDSTPGWGSRLSVTIPLDPPASSARVEDAEDLTPRELDVLRVVASGASNGEAATQLGITVNTVKFHVANLLRKYGARSRSELIALTR